ncbi:MAG: NDP-sugar synthase [Acidobacteria bacterium]|nr:NDP-sugar synthase [Acidobacteriota bacterium]MSO62086.1 NDP-sugar synthase [Acidobacteriota bacterium]
MIDSSRRSTGGVKSDLSGWPALVLTAGLATRLQPLSRVRAKAAIPVAGEALVLRILRSLRAAGVTRAVLNLHHRAETITREVGDGAALGLSVRYSWETEVLGSAGGPARALPLLEADRFLIVNGDTLASVDLGALATQHVDTGALVTMAAVDGDPKYNGILADEAGRVRGFGREPGALHFVGVQAANAAAFAGVSPDRRSETVHGIYPHLIAQRPDHVRVMRTAAEFFDIGTPRDYLATALTLAAREGRTLDRGHGCDVSPAADIRETILWNHVTIGAGASLIRCVAADRVRVPAGARHVECSLVMGDNGLVAEPF